MGLLHAGRRDDLPGAALFGLIGLDILRLTPSTAATWFWASFEQVDNTSAPSGIPATLAAAGTPNGACTSQYNVMPSGPVTGNIPWNGSNIPNNICQVTPIPQYVQTVNQAWQSQLQGTVWQYYQMVNTLNPCPTGDTSCYTFPPINDASNTINLKLYANTAIESYFQSTSTCMSCHGSAVGDGAPSTMTGLPSCCRRILAAKHDSDGQQTEAASPVPPLTSGQAGGRTEAERNWEKQELITPAFCPWRHSQDVRMLLGPSCRLSLLPFSIGP